MEKPCFASGKTGKQGQMTAFCGKEGKIHLFFAEKQSNNQKKWSSDHIWKAGQNTPLFLKMRIFQNDLHENIPFLLKIFGERKTF